MSESDDKLTARHSFYTTNQTPKQSIQTVCKSDINLLIRHEDYIIRSSNNTSECCGEYYKKYEHDEIPVKDYSSYTKANATGDSDIVSITNSQLDTIEQRVYQSMSGDLQTGDTKAKAKDRFDSISITSSHLDKLEERVNIQSNIQLKQVKMQSNIEFFKTTVNQIFDTFYESMQDFDLYKKKFNDILNKNRADNVEDMEEFIKDIIQHIMTSDSSGTNVSKTEETQSSPCLKSETNTSNVESDMTPSASKKLSHNQSIVEDYKNQNYYTDSTDDQQEKPKVKRNKGDIFNIYLLNSTPLLEIKMNERNLVSEVNIRDPHISRDSKVASAENLKKLAAKRDELEKFVQQQQDNHIPDRDIPVKVSSAKKNIHLDEDFICHREDNKSLMSKICNYFCKKFRKNTIA